MSSIRSTLQAVFRHAQADALNQALEHPEVDRKVIAVLLTTCVALTLQQYIFRLGSFEQTSTVLRWLGATDAANWICRHTYDPQDRQLAQLIFWAAGSVVTYVLIPCAVIKCFLASALPATA